MQSLYALLPLTERLKMVELRQDFESSTLIDKNAELKAEKQKLESDNVALTFERDEILTLHSHYKTQVTKQLEEKTQALNLYKSELSGFVEEAKQAKAQMEEALKHSQRVTNENLDLRTEMDKIR